MAIAAIAELCVMTTVVVPSSALTLAIAARTSLEALIAHQKLVIEKFRRELYGSRSERGHKLLDQMELAAD